MQSLVMTLRTLVMLICMIALPLAAVFWTPLTAQCRVWLTDFHSRRAASHEPADEPPPAWQPTAITDTAPLAPVVTGADAPLNSPAAEPLVAQPIQEPPPTAAREAATSRRPPRNMSQWSRQPSQPVDPRRASWGDSNASDDTPTLAGPLVPMSAADVPSDRGAVRQASGAIERPAPPSEVGGSALPRAEHAELHALLSRLKQAGATYYRLETSGDRYHFYCDVAVSRESSRERRFEAVEPQAVQAVGRVIQQVEAWQGAAVSIAP